MFNLIYFTKKVKFSFRKFTWPQQITYNLRDWTNLRFKSDRTNFLIGLILHSVSKNGESLNVKIIRYPIGTTASTGQTCPESGVWRVVGVPSTTAPIAKGNRMPPYGGNGVTWVLAAYA